MALIWSPLLHASDRPEDQLLLDLYFSVKGGRENKIKTAQLTHTKKKTTKGEGGREVEK